MLEIFTRAWPWYIAGPLIGLFVPGLLLVGNKLFGVSGSLRDMCAAVIPSRAEYFRYDWRSVGSWHLVFVLGVAIGAFLAGHFLGIPTVAISEKTRAAIALLGVTDQSGLAPPEIFSWHALLTLRGFVSIVVGGFLVGFGTAYAGGCTSGHGVAGLAALEPASLISVIGFFVGGLLATFFLLPIVL